MKSFVIICFLAVVAIAAANNKKYTSRYDYINVEEILGNKRLLDKYVMCALEKGRCTPDGLELKSHIKEALETHCANCTDAQKEGSQKVIKHLINNEPGYWKQLSAKYDPDNKFTHQYEAELRLVKAN